MQLGATRLAPAPRQPQVRGMTLRGTIGAVRRVLGERALEQMTALMTPELARHLRAGVVPNLWYPLADLRAIHATAQMVSGRGVELARTIGRESTLDDFRGVYRILTAVLSPAFLMRRTPGLFDRYYDTGRLQIPRAATHACEAFFSGCSGFDANVWQDTVGGCCAFLEVCGARDIEPQILDGGGDGDDYLRVSATWR
jgi:hypothetical protein